jgi:hypothetical protein
MHRCSRNETCNRRVLRSGKKEGNHAGGDGRLGRIGYVGVKLRRGGKTRQDGPLNPRPISASSSAFASAYYNLA